MSAETAPVAMEDEPEETEGPPRRKDGRGDSDLRAIQCDFGTLNRAHGSVKYTCGQTCVIAAVFGPLPVNQRNEFIDRATVEVTFKSVTGNNVSFDTEKQAVVRGALEAMILSMLHPRTKLAVVVQVIHNDGGLLAACMNAASLAVVDSGLPCNSMLTSSCLGVRGPETGARIILDPTKHDASGCHSVLTLTLGYSDKEKGGSVVGCELKGSPISDELYLECLEVGSQACAAVRAFCRLALTKKTANLVQT